MDKIENSSNVLEWARMVVDAKGDKFTVLSKSEQFVIAKFIVDGSYSVSREEHHNQSEKQTVQNHVNVQEVELQGDDNNPVGCDAQQAFDKFLSWCKHHPKEKEVMDFSTGEMSVAAAFAYWLFGHMKSLNVN